MIDSYAAAYVALAAALLGWIGFLFERMDKRLEKTAKEAAQGMLARHERRAQATNFQPIISTINSLTVHGGREIYWSYAGLLDTERNEVGMEFPRGETVYVPVFNLGGPFIEIHVTVPDDAAAPVAFIRYINATPDVSGFIHYPFEPAKRGSIHRIFFNYVTPDGALCRDEYQHAHGLRGLHRVEPPLLEQLNARLNGPDPAP